MQFVVQKSITEMENPPYCPDLAPNDFWLFPKMSTLKGRRFQDIEDLQKGDVGTERFSTTGVPKMFKTVAAWLR
jgi:hypothetical protein